MAEQDKSGGVQADDLVAAADTGARSPVGAVGKLLLILCFVWSIFQLYIASNVPFILQEVVGNWLRDEYGIRIWVIFNNVQARAIHLGFALALAALAFPLFKRSPRDHIPWSTLR